MSGKRGQVAIFVIFAAVLIGGLVLFLVFRGQTDGDDIPAELLPVFNYYQSCIEQETRNAAAIAGEQGGKIETGDYVPGSEYAPFSSHLNFFGSPIPYWYYVSANGVIREQVMSKEEMEREMEDFIEQGLERCSFERFYREGFDIERGASDVNVNVQDSNIVTEVNSEISVSKGDVGAVKVVHNAEVGSKLGKFYNLAREIYNEEKITGFLEEYAVDVLYLYAPVNGVEIQCSPEIWNTVDVISEIRGGLEENMGTIKFRGGDFDVEENREYFVVDKEVDEEVRVLYSRNWPTKVEIVGEGADEDILLAEGVGNQQGLGAMGFCYVPYHFVYDVSFPALIQIYDEDELFQFPVAIIIDNNVPREAVFSELSLEEEDFDLCQYPTQAVDVNLFDVNLDRADGDVSYECFNQKCRFGETRNGRIVGSVPACVNGFLHVRAEGFADKKQLFSSNSEGFADVVLDRARQVEVELVVGGIDFSGTAVASFVRDDSESYTFAFPQSDSLTISEGSYSVLVYAYGNSTLVIPATTKTQCSEIPRGGLLGFFGGTEEKCFDINIPETKIESALIGGGNAKVYILDSELERGGLRLNVERFPTPNSLDELSQNFELFDTKNIDFEFYDV